MRCAERGFQSSSELFEKINLRGTSHPRVCSFCVTWWYLPIKSITLIDPLLEMIWLLLISVPIRQGERHRQNVTAHFLKDQIRGASEACRNSRPAFTVWAALHHFTDRVTCTCSSAVINSAAFLSFLLFRRVAFFTNRFLPRSPQHKSILMWHGISIPNRVIALKNHPSTYLTLSGYRVANLEQWLDALFSLQYLAICH